MTKVWQSIDEDAIEPPLYASPENFALVQGIQEEQRTVGPVEAWLLGTDDHIPWNRPTPASKLFPGFLAWYQEQGAMSKSEASFWNKARLESTLLELAQITERFDIKATTTGRQKHFRIQKPMHEGEDFSPKSKPSFVKIIPIHQ